MSVLQLESVQSLSQLRLIDTLPSPNSSIATSVVLVTGVAALYLFDGDSTAVDDDDSTIQPADRVAAGMSGAWLRSGASGEAGIAAELELFGDGSDGAFPGGAVTMTRDMHWTVWDWPTVGGSLTGRFVARFSVEANLKGAPANTVFQAPVNGANGAAAAVGASATSPQSAGNTVLSAASSQAGGAGGINAGTQAGAIVAQTSMQGGAAGPSGGTAGGSGLGGANAGGLARANAAYVGRGASLRRVLSVPPLDATLSNNGAAAGMVCGGQTGGSGGGGGGDGAVAGAGGGSAGVGGAVGWFCAKKLIVDATTAAGCFAFKGGKGGNGGSSAAINRGGGGAGVGAGGGVFYGLFGSVEGATAVDAVNCDGGDGGTGGSAGGAGGAGAAGSDGGSGGKITICNLSKPDGQQIGETIGVAGTAGAAAVGTAGGAGGTGGACRRNLGAAA